MVFAVFGAVFAYGGWRLASNWTTRAPWKPLMLRAVDWTEERFHLKEPLGKVLSKPVPMFATAWYYCLGGISFALFAILGITGIMLAFYYQPTPEGAYASIQYIETQVLFGSAVRAIHHWSANGMVVVVVAHMLRVFITGAFKAPRELNWMSGVFLLVLTLAFGLTGYLLPWDQTAFWASTVATEIAGAEPGIGNLALVLLRGGWEVTAVTLSRFFALHVLVLPAVIVLFLVAHFFMIRRQGIARPL
jgi:quinol-cytochrome oxidoreductase complex cytochrome b subunit